MALQVMPDGPTLRASYGGAYLKDKSYQRCPVGLDIRHYLDALAWQGSPRTTRDSYESVLHKLAVDFNDFPGMDGFCTPVGSQYLRDFLSQHWNDAAASTRGHHASVVRAFFEWGVGEGRCSFNPAAKIRGPRVRNRDRNPHTRTLVAKLIRGQDSLRDEICLSLLGRLAFRKNELRLCRIQDFDLTRGLVTVHGKGGKEALLPVAYPELREAIYLHIQGEERRGHEYLLYPRSDRLRPMDPASVHRWFKRCLYRAGLPDDVEIHELRHFAADELWRTTGNLILAQQLLRHESVGTTQTYLHPTRDDLIAGMTLVDAAWGDAK